MIAYEFVGEQVRKFWESTYYGDVIISFDQSYDGKEWTHEVEYVQFYPDDIDLVCYLHDWSEGQTYIQNLRIWHLEDSEIAVNCNHYIEILNEIIESYKNNEYPEYFQDDVYEIFKREGITDIIPKAHPIVRCEDWGYGVSKEDYKRKLSEIADGILIWTR